MGTMKRRRTDVRLKPDATDDEIAMPARFGADAGREA
jgi:hypothetical protein